VIPLNRNSDKCGLTIFGIDSVIDLIVKTRHMHIRKYFQVIIAFENSAFITSWLLFLPTNMALKRYLACRTFSKCQSYSN